MSSSVLSNTNCCGPVTGLLSNQTFLLHAQPQQKINSPPPIWRTFYTPPSSNSSSTLPTDDNFINGTDISVSPTSTPTLTPSPTVIQQQQQQQQQHFALTLLSTHKGYNNKNNNNYNNNNNSNNQIVPENLQSQRMTLQKLPNSIIEHTTPNAVATIQKSTSIMSVSKLVRPTPKNQHPHQQQHHHHQLHHQHHQQQQQHVGLRQSQHQLSSGFTTDMQTGPMNLVTNTQQSSDTTMSRSRPSSTSSVDIESDDIPETQQQQQQHQQNYGGVVSSSHQQVEPNQIPAAYQLNYNHLYGNKSSYSSNAMAAAADTLRLHASYSYAAIAAVAAASATTANSNIYPPISAMSSASLSHHQQHHQAASTSAHFSMAPPLSLTSTVTTTAVPLSVQSPRLTDHHQHQHQHQEQQKQRLNINDNLYSPPLLTAIPTALSNGTYLNSKSLIASVAESTSENYFKVPNTSGKEGSLKHRILTRPASLTDKEEKATKNATISTYNSTANFKKGSFIELANGVLRRVEDMRTEDFIQCADRSLHLQLAESTVVKIDATKPHMVVITFSYERNRSKADIEVSVDHPFFVYGQGWASCDPEKSHKEFGLKCQRLQVGDICISLTQRINPITTAIKTEKMTSKETTSNVVDVMRYAKNEPIQDGNDITVPLSIKNELQSIMPPPTGLNAQVQYQQQQQQNNTNSVVHRVPPVPVPPAPPLHFMPCHLPTTSHHQLTFPEFPDLVAAAAAAAAAAAYNNGAHLHHLPTTIMPPPPSPDAINGFYQQTQQLFLQGKVTAADLRLQSPSLTTSSTAVLNYCPSRTSILTRPGPLLDHSHHIHQDQPFDASIASRKRRWSAPEGDCDEVPDRRDHCQNPKLYKAIMAPVTT